MSITFQKIYIYRNKPTKVVLVIHPPPTHSNTYISPIQISIFDEIDALIITPTAIFWIN